MSVSNANIRPLCFPLQSVLAVVGDTPNDGTPQETISGFPSDPNEKIDITLNLSLNEYIALASTVDVGRDIAYGIDTNLIWWIWCRAFIGVPPLTCEQIIECIETDIGVQNALVSYLQSSGLIDPDTVDADTTTVPMRFAGSAQDLEDEIGTLDDCNLDVLWGAIRHGIVLYLDDNARNFLEDLNTQADKGQRAASLLEAIPVVGDLASSVTLQFVELVPDLLNLFNAYSSETVLDEIACAIFETVCSQCRFPTWNELFSYYGSAGISGINDVQNLVLTAATDYLLGSSQLAALACYHTIITYELFVLYLGAKFNGAQGTSSIALWGGLGEDFASDNWIALCDGCEPNYPTLVNGWCVNGVEYGATLLQENANTWLITFGEPAHAVTFEDVTQVHFEILTLVIQYGGSAQFGHVALGDCTDSGQLGAWSNQLGHPTARGYFMSANVASQIRITVGTLS